MITFKRIRAAHPFLAAVGIAVALIGLLVALTTLRSPYPTRGTIEDFSTLDVGDPLSLPGVDFAASPATLVVFLSPTCPACRTNPALYAAVLAWARSAGMPAVLVNADGLPLAPSRGQTLRRISMTPSKVSVLMVPTISVVDQAGKVKAAKIGAVEPGREKSLVDQFRLGAPAVSTELRGISAAELQLWRARTQGIQVLNVREVRGNGSPSRALDPTGSVPIVIPITELALRAPYELDPRLPVVVDCRTVRRLVCQSALLTLREADFTNIRGLEYQSSNRSTFAILSRVRATLRFM